MRNLLVSLITFGLLVAPAVAQEPQTDRSPAALTGRDDRVLTVYEQQAFSGAAYSFTQTTSNISSMQRFASLRTTGGPWQVCDKHGFKGDCRVLEGRYRTLSQVGLREIRSARPVSEVPQG